MVFLWKQMMEAQLSNLDLLALWLLSVAARNHHTKRGIFGKPTAVLCYALLECWAWWWRRLCPTSGLSELERHHNRAIRGAVFCWFWRYHSYLQDVGTCSIQGNRAQEAASHRWCKRWYFAFGLLKDLSGIVVVTREQEPWRFLSLNIHRCRLRVTKVSVSPLSNISITLLTASSSSRSALMYPITVLSRLDLYLGKPWSHDIQQR